MIIASNQASVTPFVDSLATWKMRKGLNVIEDRRASWTANQMITAIQTQYANADPPLEFVCLIGDPQASFGVPTSASDHAFALGNSGDDLEDIGVGRLSGASTSELATINAKIFAYERDPYMEDTQWFTRAFIYTGVGAVASNWTWAQWADQVLSIHTGVNNNVVSNYSGSVNQTYICDILDDGVCMFFWRGSWVGEMPNEAANCLTGVKQPICLTITCGTGEYESGQSVSLKPGWLPELRQT